MKKEKYDFYKILVKKREDTNSLLVLVEYHKDGKIVEQKRTTNSELIMRILKTAANTSKNIDYFKKNLIAEYYDNGIINIENYDEIKSAPEFAFFNKKIVKKINKEKKQSEELNIDYKSEKQAVLASIKNLKVTRDVTKLNKIKKLTFKLVPLATLSVVVMTQIMPIVRNLPSFKSNDKKIMMDEEQKIADFSDGTFSIGNAKITLPELYTNLSNDEQQILSKEMVEEESHNNKTIMSVPNTAEINQGVLENETNQNTTENLVIEEDTLNSQAEKESVAEEMVSSLQDKTQESETQSIVSSEIKENIQSASSMDSVTPVMENTKEEVTTVNEQENEIQEPSVSEVDSQESKTQSSVSSEIEENIQSASSMDSVTPFVENVEEEVTTVNEEENEIQEPSAIEATSQESKTQFSASSEIEENIQSASSMNSVTPVMENTKEEVTTVNEEEIPTTNTISNNELSSYASTVSSEFPIFKSKSYMDSITEEQLYKMAAIIAGEDSYTYEGSLAAISTVLNRCDTSRYQEYGGNNPYNQLFYPSQFTAKDASISQRYLNHPEEIPDFVIAAVTDGLNGYRNHTYTSFRAGNGDNRVRIGEHGNYYFNSSSEVVNYGYVADNNKTI